MTVNVALPVETPDHGYPSSAQRTAINHRSAFVSDHSEVIFMLCRLSTAVFATLEANDKSIHTPDLQGSGTTRLFTDTVIKYMDDH